MQCTSVKQKLNRKKHIFLGHLRSLRAIRREGLFNSIQISSSHNKITSSEMSFLRITLSVQMRLNCELERIQMNFSNSKRIMLFEIRKRKMSNQKILSAKLDDFLILFCFKCKFWCNKSEFALE